MKEGNEEMKRRSFFFFSCIRVGVWVGETKLSSPQERASIKMNCTEVIKAQTSSNSGYRTGEIAEYK